MRNPFALPEFMTKTGLDKGVQEYMRTDALFDDILKIAMQKALAGEEIGFGCYGGQHRSVAMAEITVRELRRISKEPFEVAHRDLHGQ
jgi:RNase adaptor protein for sRNA GlmZ degradation